MNKQTVYYKNKSVTGSNIVSIFFESYKSIFYSLMECTPQYLNQNINKAFNISLTINFAHIIEIFYNKFFRLIAIGSESALGALPSPFTKKSNVLFQLQSFMKYENSLNVVQLVQKCLNLFSFSKNVLTSGSWPSLAQPFAQNHIRL